MKTHRKAAILAAALSGAVLLALLIIPTAAVAPSQTAATQRPGVTILVDGTQRTFYNVNGSQVHPIYAHGTHYLPVRAIGELMGKNVNWDAAARTIGLTSPRTAPATTGTPDVGAKECQITAEVRPDIHLVVDGTEQSFCDAAGNPVYPLLYQGTNYLPVRAIGELMGKSVDWDAANKTICLGSGTGAPNVTDADTFQPSGTSNSGTTATPSNPGSAATQPSLIGEANAKQYALALVPGATAQHICKCELDRDDGIWIYEVEIFYNSTEYEIELDGTTGRVVKMEQEYKGPSTGTGTSTPAHHYEYEHYQQPANSGGTHHSSGYHHSSSYHH